VREYPHGTRRRYQIDGCPCAACRAANTAYGASYREARRAGRPLLGAHVASPEAARVIAALLEDGFPKTQIATWLGQPWLCYLRRPGDRVTVRTLLRLRAVQRRVTT